MVPPFSITVTECHQGFKGHGWVIFGDARGRYIPPGTVVTDEDGGEVTVIGVVHMRMANGPSKWGWAVDRETPVGTVLRERT